MQSLFELSMSKIANCFVEKHKDNFTNSCDSFLTLLESFPKLPSYIEGFVSAVLNKLNGFITSQDYKGSEGDENKQKELIPLLKICSILTKNLCVESYINESAALGSKFTPKYRDETLFKIMIRLNYKMKSAIVDAISETEDIKLSVLHYTAWQTTEPPSSLFHLLETQSISIVSLKLGWHRGITMPNCAFVNLRV